MCNQISTDLFTEKSLSHSDRWNETCFNDQCNVLIMSIFAIYLPKSGARALPTLHRPPAWPGTFETYDEDVWFNDAEKLGGIMEEIRLDLIQSFNYEVNTLALRGAQEITFLFVCSGNLGRPESIQIQSNQTLIEEP